MNYKIIGKIKNGDDLLGTCFLINKRKIISAYHVIEKITDLNELNVEILKELLKIESAECTICENGEKILEEFEAEAK